MNNLQLKPINLDNDYEVCVANRYETYVVSFGNDDGFDRFLSGYKERMADRMTTLGWFYRHLWSASDTGGAATHHCSSSKTISKIIGQFEYKAFSQLDNYGYIHLFYINKDYRGTGVATQALQLIATSLRQKGCKGVILSVSSNNPRAIAFYKKIGFTYLSPNDKHALSDFYIKAFIQSS